MGEEWPDIPCQKFPITYIDNVSRKKWSTAPRSLTVGYALHSKSARWEGEKSNLTMEKSDEH